MPSDAKKREQQKKKEALKTRNKKIPTAGGPKETNGTKPEEEMTEEGKFPIIILSIRGMLKMEIF